MLLNLISKATRFHALIVIWLFAATGSGASAQNINFPPPIKLGVTVTLQGLGGNCLDVLNGNSQSGAHVDNFTCNGTQAQVFNLNFNGTITNFAGKCLDVLYGDANAGVIDFADCNGTAAQQWKQDGTQFIGLAGKCLDVLYGNTGPGTTVDLAACNGTLAQNWQVINAPTVLEAVGSKCLDIIDSNTSPGARLQIFECNRGPNAQIFTFTAAGEIRNSVGECLDIIGANAAAGQVQMWPCNGGTNQKWLRIGREIATAMPMLISTCLGTVNTLNPGPSPLQVGWDHTAVGLVTCNGTEAQQWIAADLMVFGPSTLLIVTSDGFASSFSNFVSHKNSIGIPTELVTMTQVRKAFPASDDATSLKCLIEDRYRNFGTKYVLLGGDASHVPVRTRGLLDGNGATHSFETTDLYYENLYSGHGPFSGMHAGFDNWDSNGDGLFDYQDWNNPLQNPDNVDGFPDVAVGRIPAYNASVLTAALNKIINYENQTSFPPAGKYGWVADACYGGAYGDVQSLSNARPGSSFAEEINASQGCNAPSSGFTDDDSNWSKFEQSVQQSNYEWITYIGHGGPSAWGYNGSWTDSMANSLSNQYQPVVFAVACQTAMWEFGFGGEPLHYRPPVYDTNAIAYSSTNIGANWIFNPNGGAVAYVGENIVLQDDIGTAFVGYLFHQYSNGFAMLGDVWRVAQQEYFDYNFINPGYDPHFSPPRIYLGIVSLLGDPSMRLK